MIQLYLFHYYSFSRATVDVEATVLEFIPENLKILGGGGVKARQRSIFFMAPLHKKDTEKKSTIIYPLFEYFPSNSPNLVYGLWNTILSTEQSPSH